MEARALELIKEALLDLPELTPVGVEARLENNGENLCLTVLLQANGQRAQLEVTV